MQCGLLGETLGHSYSPQIHAELADYSYRLYEKKPEEVPDFVRFRHTGTIRTISARSF